MRTRKEWWRSWRRYVCAAILMLGATGARAQEAALLAPGATVVRELKGGESQTYRVSLAAGQFLRVMVEQQGIDVAVTVSGPDGRQILRADSPNGRSGAELVALVAEAAGEHRLEVSAPGRQAPAGRYEIRLAVLREATPRDREQAAAERAFAEAYQKLRPQRTTEARRAAIERYGEAMRFYQASEDRYRYALIASSIGVIHMELNEPGRASDYFNRALPEYQALRLRGREAAMRNYLGGAADILGDLTGALRHYEQALPAARAEGDRLTEVSILNNIGKIHNDLADWQKSLEYYNQALPLIRALGDPRREAIAIHNIGIAQAMLGEADKALAWFQQELPIRRAIRDKVGEADTLNGMGAAFALLGERAKAMEQHAQALSLSREAADRGSEAETLRHIGNLQMLMGEPSQARASFSQALPLARNAEQRRLEAMILADLGRASAPAESFAHFRQALEIFRAIGDRQSEAKSLQGLARAERDAGNPAEARKLIEAAISLVEEVRGRVTSGELRASYLATRQDAYEFHIDLLMRLHERDRAAGFDALALQAGERARARSLLDMLTESRVNIREGVDAALLDRERELRQRINARAAKLLQRNSPARIEELKKEIALLESEYQQLEAGIRRSSPHYAAITHPEPLGLREIQQQGLDDETLLLEYSLGEERSYLWAIGKRSFASYALPGRAEIDRAGRRVAELLGARSLRLPGETPAERAARRRPGFTRRLSGPVTPTALGEWRRR